MGERRAALITGSATGIGRAIVVHLARGGFDVTVNYSRSKDAALETVRLAQAEGANAIMCAADVSDEESVKALVEAHEAEHGRLDLLVNNAGTTIDTPPNKFAEVELDDFQRVFDVNVSGVFLMAKHSLPLLRKQDRADIINTASIVGLRPGPQPLPYSASKAAVISMTQTLAGALGPDIRVNALAPGWMEGEWMERALGENYDRLMDRRAKMTPLKRCATADDVGEAALALATNFPFTTGQVIVIDGGYAAVT